MEDERIIELYFERNEQALEETAAKYQPRLFSLALNITENREDASECVNDCYLDVWKRIPPHRPQNFYAFLSKPCAILH